MGPEIVLPVIKYQTLGALIVGHLCRLSWLDGIH